MVALSFSAFCSRCRGEAGGGGDGEEHEEEEKGAGGRGGRGGPTKRREVQEKKGWAKKSVESAKRFAESDKTLVTERSCPRHGVV